MSQRVVRAPGEVLVHLRRARDLIDRDYAEPLDLERIAAEAGLSRWHFHRLFSATYGITPAAYLSQRRVERAQDLLRATDLTVTEVCHAVGFSSLGSFSAGFKADRRGDAGRVPAALGSRRRRASPAAGCSWPGCGEERASQEKRGRRRSGPSVLP